MSLALRLVLALVGGVLGYELAKAFVSHDGYGPVPYYALVVIVVIFSAIVGAFVGSILGRVITRLGRRLDRAYSTVTASGLIFSTFGLLVGLAIAGLSSLAIKDLPIVGIYFLPLLFAVSGYLFAYLGFKRHTDIARLFGLKGLLQQAGVKQFIRPKILDTSVIIDGRLGDVVATGFVEGDLIVPGFVLEELQAIADSTDPARRARGRRGLDTVHALQEAHGHVSIIERDFLNVAEVDAKLIRLAKEIKGVIVTTDYNLNKVSQIQGVEVLNINDLANTLKPVVMPGESMRVKVIREGKEDEQGVGYLDDGTMVVIEGGRRHIGDEVEVEVTSVLQNPSGKMIFTRVAQAGNGAGGH
jgi:uncharacterized protein YacL